MAENEQTGQGQPPVEDPPPPPVNEGQDGATGTSNPDSEAQKEATIAAQEGSNVRLSALKQPITVDGPINIGTYTIDMPSEVQQRAGFRATYKDRKGQTQDAAWLLIQQYRGVYKRAENVGQSREVKTAEEGQPKTDSLIQTGPEDGGENDGDS
jgi:hypothetical protein